MQVKRYDALVVGGGSAGLAAAEAIANKGLSVVVVERENRLGGILNQCIHNGFGLHYFKEELTGPEFAERFIHKVKDLDNIDIFTEMTIVDVEQDEHGKKLYGYSHRHGLITFEVSGIVLAMGCRERNRGNILTPGSRPSGVYTAGLAQYLVNMEGYIPGKEVVIVGSGDIGLIMARRMTWVGCNVKAVVEINPYPAGLTRNIVQCLNDFNIPLYLSHVVSRIHGKDRITGVDVTPRQEGILNEAERFHVPCDTLLLSVGLVPDNEISKKIGVELNPMTNGPLVDARLMTNVEGVFACGNVLHVHDLVDFVTEEAARCGEHLADYVKDKKSLKQYRTISGANVRYVVPNSYSPEMENKLYLRSMIVKNRAELVCRIDGQLVKKKRVSHVQPSEMISVTLTPEDFKTLSPVNLNTLEVGLE